MPDISQTKQPRETEKKTKPKQNDATFMYNPQNLRMCTITTFFLQVFDLVKNAKKRRG